MANKNNSNKAGELSLLQKTLIGIVILFFLCIPFFWYLEMHLGVPQSTASISMTVFVIFLFATALLLPWLKLPGQEMNTKSQRLDKMVIIWIFICLSPRIIWEIPWLLFLDEIRQGIADGALWSYFWSPILLGGDARYLDGDPLIVTLEGIAIFVGLFEGWALWRFFVQGKKIHQYSALTYHGGHDCRGNPTGGIFWFGHC